MDFFGKPIIELNDSQKEVLYWCSYYRGIFQRPETPPDKYLDNDYALDRWLEISKFKETTNSKAESHDMVFGVVNDGP